jgi:hypothetical protein
VNKPTDWRSRKSAVLHADEWNLAEWKRLWRDVFHYDLHVVYIPVVGKKVYLKKDNKNPKLVRKLKEVIKQVSHNKKWRKLTQTDGETVSNAKGKAVLVNSSSLLQGRFSEHMRKTGFESLGRGE